MSMVFDRSWPLNGISDKADKQDLPIPQRHIA